MENKKFVVTIVILIIIILGLGGFIALDKFVINKKDDDTITQIGDEEINLNAFMPFVFIRWGPAHRSTKPP